MSDGRLRWLIIAIVLIYMISPVDAMPGPFDDIMVMVVGAIANHRIKAMND
jgi:uncharacterized membrane protein YkvA (DUF1232 family)